MGIIWLWLKLGVIGGIVNISIARHKYGAILDKHGATLHLYFLMFVTSIPSGPISTLNGVYMAVSGKLDSTEEDLAKKDQEIMDIKKKTGKNSITGKFYSNWEV